MKNLSLILSVFFLFSCATGYKRHGFNGGFSEQRLSRDMYLVHFSGNRYTSSSIVQTYLLKRCAELTLNSGFTHFIIVNSNNDTTSDLLYQTRSNGQGNISTINKHQSSATIKMVTNPSKDQIFYDARIIFGGRTEQERTLAGSGDD